MKFTQVYSVLLLLLPWCCLQSSPVFAQKLSDAAIAVSSGIWDFSFELLARTAEEAGNLNIVMSPYSIWSLLSILNEGAGSETASQLKNALHIPADNDVFRYGYRAIESSINSKNNEVELETTNAIFTNRNKQLLREFQAVATSLYKVNFIPIDFTDARRAVNLINNYVANATRNRVPEFVAEDDVREAQLLLTTAIFFKGQWSIPFNRSATFIDTFYDEDNRPAGKVTMMYQSGTYAYTILPDMQGHAVELPYGKNVQYSMVIILPRKNVPLQKLLNTMRSMTAHKILNDLEQAKEEFYDDEVQVYLPRFKISSDFIMNVILEKMGIVNVFDSRNSDLYKISRDNLFLSRVIHKAEIEVNEEGTVASAATGGSIAYKSPPPKFYANRPFAYFIVDKTTRTLLFVGKVSNPVNL